MKTTLILSPHLDDAAFSLGPLLAAIAPQTRAIVATAFTKSWPHPVGFALACQLDKGLPADTDYMAVRRKEDDEWAGRLGLEVVHGPFAEAPHRGYDSVQELFGPVLAADREDPGLTKWITGLISSLSPEIVFIPLALGNHVDHQWLRWSAGQAKEKLRHAVYFKDLPYASRLQDEDLSRHLGAVGCWQELSVSMDQEVVRRALAAAEAYQTQISFQFGGLDKMASLLGSAWGKSLTLYQETEVDGAGQLLAELTRN